MARPNPPNIGQGFSRKSLIIMDISNTVRIGVTHPVMKQAFSI